jgi:hypothetical protein
MMKISEKNLNRTRKENGGKQGGKKKKPTQKYNVHYTCEVNNAMKFTDINIICVWTQIDRDPQVEPSKCCACL